MNECPLPSPLLVLRDVYKSRSPGQPAEFHEIPRCKSEKRDWKEKKEEKEIRDTFTENYAPELAMGLDRVCVGSYMSKFTAIKLEFDDVEKVKNYAFFIVWSSRELKKPHQDWWKPER